MDKARPSYSGRLRKLVVALDIGTTFSGAAYALLDPGKVPQIRSVTRYLNNPNPGSTKVPSMLYYDHEGKFCGVENGVDFQDSDGFLKMKWWKLMLSPLALPAAMKDRMSTELPRGKTIVDVFADFMRYLFESTETLFKTSEPNVMWDSISSIELVLSHPNAWGGPEQSQLRSAAVKAGIVSDTPAGHDSVHFVTEGEACFNFCASEIQAGEKLEPGEQVLIIDAGGGTIDISTYRVLSNGPLHVEELYEPKCLVQGGELVTARATAMVREELKYSKFNTPEDLAAFSRKFDKGVKKIFSTANSHADQHVKFGSPRDNDPDYGIKAGKITLTGAQVAASFEPSIRSTVDTIRDNFRRRLPTKSFAFLVGGLATSPWLSEQLEKRLLEFGFRFFKPDTHTDKAVAIGAVSYHVDHFVIGRISKFTYGVFGNPAYNPSDPEHVRRPHKVFINAMGERRISGRFFTMLSRGTNIVEDREIRQRYCSVTEGAPQQHDTARITKYTGALFSPEWEDLEPDKFETLCCVMADLSGAPYISIPAGRGKKAYRRDYDVILLVGLTELKAQIGWIDSETGKEERFVATFSELVRKLNPTLRGDAVVVYDNPSERV